MSTETDTLPSVETLAARIYLATSSTRHLLAYELLPEEAKQAYRRLVREAQAAELERIAREYDRRLAAGSERQRTSPGSLAADHAAANAPGLKWSRDGLRQRADELRLIGGAA